jgi:opacity protein-like surface antigen
MSSKFKFLAVTATLLLASTAAMASVTAHTSAVIATTGSFSDTFEATTTSPYNSALGTLYVTGLTANFSDLKLTFFDANNTLIGTAKSENIGVKSGATNLKATFSDSKVAWNLGAGTTYKFVVSGTSKVAGSSLAVNGLYFSNIAAVPEPETYAMLLAGLGLMGAIAKRRKAKQA